MALEQTRITVRINHADGKGDVPLEIEDALILTTVPGLAAHLSPAHDTDDDLYTVSHLPTGLRVLGPIDGVVNALAVLIALGEIEDADWLLEMPFGDAKEGARRIRHLRDKYVYDPED